MIFHDSIVAALFLNIVKTTIPQRRGNIGEYIYIYLALGTDPEGIVVLVFSKIMG